MNTSVSAHKQQPNVIWFFGDQLRAQAISRAGDPNVSTPNIDRLAAEGAYFTHAVAGTPLCSPFRGSLVTGRYPHRSTVPGHDHPLSTDMPTIAHAFRNEGYRTCWIGKWHLDGNRPELDLTAPEHDPGVRHIPPERRGGFEDWYAYENNNQPYNGWLHRDENGVTCSERIEGYETDGLTSQSIRWLRHHREARGNTPFFLSLSVQPPHNPYVAPAVNMIGHRPQQVTLRPNVPPVESIERRARRDLAGYYAAIERLDYNLGRLRDTLEELGLSENTYIVFFSDHGDLHGSHGQFRKTAPWEEAIRIPFIIGGPPREHQNCLEIDHPLNHVDIAPTTLGLCGIPLPAGMDGTDYSTLLAPSRGQTAADYPDSAYLSLPVATGHQDSMDRPFRGIVTADGWKYVVLEGQPLYMFNLSEDPYELANLAFNRKYAARRRQLQLRLAQWIEQTGDKFTLPKI